MAIQKFRVTVIIETDVESSGKPYLTETRVKRQVEKFLRGRKITDGLPCHGASEIRVTDCIET